MSAAAVTEPMAARVKRDARVFVDGLADRMMEFDDMAERSNSFVTLADDNYGHFKTFFLDFIARTEEFQILSTLTEDALGLLERYGCGAPEERRELDECFRRLQIGMLQRFVSTQLLLLKVWEERWRQGSGLPYGSCELFNNAISVIHTVKDQLLRPRYVSMLDERTIEDAENAERLVRALIKHSPRYHDFGAPGADDIPAGALDNRQPFLPGLVRV